MDHKQVIETNLTVSAETVGKRAVFIIHHWIFLQLKTTQINSLKVLHCVMLCGFEFALRNILWVKLNFCVQIIFVFCVTLEYEKENSEYNLSFWPHPRITSRYTGFQAAHIQIIIACKSKKNAFQLGYITKLFVPYQAEWTDDFYTPSSVWKLLNRTMLIILLSALIIINLLNWIPM